MSASAPTQATDDGSGAVTITPDHTPPLPSLAAPIPAACVCTLLPLESEADAGRRDAGRGIGESGLGFTLDPLVTADEAAALVAWGEAVGIEEEPTARKDIRSNTRLRFFSDELAADLFARIEPFLEPHIVIPAFDADAPADPSLGSGHRCGQDGTWELAALNPLFRLCRYEPGAHFAPHYDGQFVRNDDEVSFKTCMLYLSHVGDGGATEFLHASAPLFRDDARDIFCAPPDAVYLSLPPAVGRAIIFNHRVLHAGAPLGPTASLKYILRTDVMYRRVANTRTPLPPRLQRGLDAYTAAGAAEDAGDMDEATRLYALAFRLDPSLGWS